MRLIVRDNEGKQAEAYVTVKVGNVIANVWGGKVRSSDDKVIMTVPEQSIIDDFEVLSIIAVDSGIVDIEEGFVLTGSIYEIEPPGEQFSKDVTLEMNYTDGDLGGLDETKLGIYVFNPSTFNWDYLSASQDTENNSLAAVVTEIASPYAYYAILAKTSLPEAPLLYNSFGAGTQLRYVTVSGIAERGASVEIFVNGISRGTTATAQDTGLFSVSGILLDDGLNSITALAIDPFGQVSPLSEPITVTQAETLPSSITSVSFKDSAYASDYSGTVSPGDSLYIEIIGMDSNSATIDTTTVELTSSITDPDGITVQLVETDYDSGVYRAEAGVGLTSSQADSIIAAYQDAEIITARSKMDGAKFDTVTVSDNAPPEAPRITSSTHPSACQNTFEDGFGEWENRDGEVGAALYLNSSESSDGGNCLELVNIEEGGNFASSIRNTEFDAHDYPIVSFDYKIGEDVKINFLVKTGGMWHEIVFTDDIKSYWSVNMQEIGRIEGVIADGEWHSASFNLYEMLRAKTWNFIVEEMLMADWDAAGFMKLIYGTNPASAVYYIDNFRITRAGFANDSPQFNIVPPQDSSGIAGYSYAMDNISGTIPDSVVDTAETVVNFENLSDGAWYFHLRAKDGAGNWSETNHYKLAVDTVGPVADLPDPSLYDYSGNPVMTLRLTDNEGTGVKPETIRFKVEGEEYDLTSPAMAYDTQSEILTFIPLVLGIIWPDGHLVNAELTVARDYAGNSLQETLEWEWTLDYSQDTTPPQAPAIISPAVHNLSYNTVTFMWQAEDENGIADYSFILDEDAYTVPDTAGEGLTASKIYSGLPDGTYYFHIIAKDRPGNWSEVTHYQITIGSIQSVLADNFNDGADPNQLGGYSEIITGANGDCQFSYYNADLNNVFGGEGYSLELVYDVIGEADYAGYRTGLGNMDLSDYKSLTFWIKGAAGNEILEIGLVDIIDIESKVLINGYLSAGLSTEWQRVVIPLTAFIELDSLEEINSLEFVFADNIGSQSGAVYIDEIRFEEAIEPVIVDTFNDGLDPNSIGGETGVLVGIAAEIDVGYDPTNAHNNSAYGYAISYDNVTPWYHYALWRTVLRDVDASHCNSLSFAIKGANGGESPHIYLTDTQYGRAFVELNKYKEVTTSWQDVNIPLLDFIKQGVDVNSLKELHIVFEWQYASGTIYIDDIRFDNAEFPEAPLLDSITPLTNQNILIITGAAEPGQEIIAVIEVPGIGSWAQPAVIADENGNFTIDLYITCDGQKQIYVYARDSQKGASQNSAYQTVILDQTSPLAPTIDGINSPRENPDITVSGSAETGCACYIRLTRPNSGLIEYDTQAAAGTYRMDITLDEGDGNYQIVVVSKDDADNYSPESAPVEVILDAVNETPSVVILQPSGGELVSSDVYDILWQAIDPDPEDELSIDIRYTNSLNQTLIDDFNDNDYLNSLGGSFGTWNDNGAVIESAFNNNPAVTYGGSGLSLELNYDVSAQDNSNSGFWTGLSVQPDMSAYGFVSLLIKGADGGESFKIGLKDFYYSETKLLINDYLLNGVTTEWQRVSVPLTDFAGVDIASSESLSITFENGLGANSGTLYVDEIRFVQWQDIAFAEPNTGVYPWTITGLPESDRYLIKVTAEDLTGLRGEDESNDYFTLTVNMAKDKDVTASSEEAWDYASYKAVDGDYGSRWSSGFTDPQWIQIDLGGEETINKVILRWEAAYATSYSIQASDDAVDWRTVYSTGNGDGSIDEIIFADTTARYIRMYGTERATPYGYSLWEFEVYYDKVSVGSISGKVTLQARTGHSELITFELRNHGETMPIKTFQVTSDIDGNYILPDIRDGVYDITAKAVNSLRAKQSDIAVIEGGTVFDIGFELLFGDADGNNVVNIFDHSLLNGAFGSSPGDSNWDERADFDGNGVVNIFDHSILNSNFGKTGEE
ncbi:MAG: discoidin domain-containing protein [Candidatus Omnitrophota bacterium]|nr:discoidin domain-containing protein [Candidatus Omnitrophota bacterium]